MASDDLLAKRDKIQREILALENTLGADSSIADLLSSDSSNDDESDDSGPTVEGLERDDLETERLRIQQEIEELENSLGANAAVADVIQESEVDTDSSDEDGDDDLDLPQTVETCLQMNLVYQEVLNEKLAELEQLLSENQQHQKEVEAQISGPSPSGSSVIGHAPQKHFLGYFMKPYFKDKLTGLAPPANEETKERLRHGTRPVDQLKIRRWEGWQKTLLTNAVTKDTMKRMLQPKLSKLDYLSAKMSRAEGDEKEELKKQIDFIEKQIAEISALKDDQLMGNRHDDHDWEKISNIDFEGLRQADDLKRFWQNFLHPSIDKSVWKKDEIDKLEQIVEEYKCCHWDKIAEALGTNRTAYMCFQTYQRYISKTFRRNQWTKEEDQLLRELVEKMRIGNFIPYTQMSHFMVGRDGSQLSYRWTSVLDPSIKKGPWSKEEDQLLRNAVAKYGTREWGKIRLEVPGRTDSACRDRYLDCLQDNVKKGPWSEEEVELLKQKVEKYGVGKWTKIASEIPNRLDCQCLNKWKLLTQASLTKGLKRPQSKQPKKQTTAKQKRRKVLKKIIKEEMEMTSSSEDENQIKYINSDSESDDPMVEDLNLEIQLKDYIQPDMKEWIPVNPTTLLSPGALRMVWVRSPADEEEPQESSNESNVGCIRSENSVSPNVGHVLVRNTIMNRFGNMERSYVGMNPTVLQRQTDDEKPMIKVSVSDLKHFIHWKVACLMKREKMKGSGNKKKKRSVQDIYRLHNDLLKAITPWIGNVIMPAPANENTFCEGDIVGIKTANITLLKTSVFTFFIKAFQIDVMGCRNIIEIQQNKGICKPHFQKPVAQPVPRQTPPKTVAVMLKEAKQTNEHKKPAEPPQQPPPLQSVRQLKPPQPLFRQMMTPALIHPNTLVITQPNMQGAATGLLNGLLLPTSSPKAISQTPLPLIQQTVLAQPITTSTSKSQSVENSNCGRSTKRTRKPTKKAQDLMQEAKAKRSKKESPKQNNGNKTVVFPNVTFQTQPVIKILSPTRLVQVNGPVFANIPSNQTPNNPRPNSSTQSFTITNLNQSVVAASSVSPTLVRSSTLNGSRDTLNTSSSLNISPRGSYLNTSSLAQNKSVQHSVQVTLTPAKVVQKDSHVKATKNSSDSSSDEFIVRHNQSTPSAPPAVFSVFPVPFTVPTLASGPVVSANGCISTVSQLPTVIRQFPAIIQKPERFKPIQPLGPLPQVATPSPRIVATSVVHQIMTSSEPLIPLPLISLTDLPSDNASFDPHLIFPEQSSEVDDWMNGKGGIPLPHLETSLPYLPPCAANIKTLTSLLKVKRSLLTAAVKILPTEYQNDREEEAQVAAIRKMTAQRFASNPAYLLFKARFLSCFTLPALLATINPSEECHSPTDNNCEDDEVLDLQQTNESILPPAPRTELNTNENEASAKQFSGIGTKRQRSRRRIT